MSGFNKLSAFSLPISSAVCHFVVMAENEREIIYATPPAQSMMVYEQGRRAINFKAAIFLSPGVCVLVHSKLLPRTMDQTSDLELQNELEMKVDETNHLVA